MRRHDWTRSRGSCRKTRIRNGSASVRLTRRGFLGGAASLAAGQVLAAPAAADFADYRLVYVDEGKRDEVALVDGAERRS